MTPSDTPAGTPVPSAHLLACELARRIGARRPKTRSARVLIVGIGSGRNVAPFRDAGIAVVGLTAADVVARRERDRFDAALSTHALVHGSARDVAATLAAIRACLDPGAPLYATFGSTRDPRFGRGIPIDDATFAPLDGPEAGVPHAFFDAARLDALLGDFDVESREEVAAADHVGSWAHDAADAATIVHWFVRATVPAARDDQ